MPCVRCRERVAAAIARRMRAPNAALAQRYAPSMPGVDTVVLGVKHHAELRNCLAATAAGTLRTDLMNQVETQFSTSP